MVAGGDIYLPDSGVEVKKTICAICEGASTSCAMNVYVRDGRVLKVEGMKEFPHNRGTLCAKGNATRQYVYNAERLRAPLRRTGRRGGGFVEISWEEAYGEIAERLLAIKKKHGAEAVVFGVGYSKWLRPFAQRLAISFGSPNFATESSTCHFATVIAARLTYGAWGAPDIANCRSLLVWGRNPFFSATPGARPLIEAAERGVNIVEVNPLVTHLSRYATLRLVPRPGSDGALALGLARVIVDEGLHDREFIDRHTHGFTEYRALISRFTPQETERLSGVPADDVVRAARLIAGSGPAAIMTSASSTVHHLDGVQNHRAILCLSGLTGNFDAPGGNHVVPETWLHVGCSAATRQREFTYPRPLAELPPRVGADAFPVWCRFVGEAQAMHLPQQILSGRPYPLRAMLAFGYNHRMWPGNDVFERALDKLDFFVDVDLFLTPTARRADIVLPACSSLERSELRFYPCDHVILTEPAIAPLGLARADSDIIIELARRIAPEDTLLGGGYEACLDYILQPSGLTVAELKRHPSGLSLGGRPGLTAPGHYKYRRDGFATPTGKMEFVSTVLGEMGFAPLPVATAPGSDRDEAADYPLMLVTGVRLPMYMHSRTFRNSWNRQLHPLPTVALNPQTAAARGIDDGEEVLLRTRRGEVRVRAQLTGIVPADMACIYHGWPEIEVNRLLHPEHLDPISGFPACKSLRCAIDKAPPLSA